MMSAIVPFLLFEIIRRKPDEEDQHNYSANRREILRSEKYSRRDELHPESEPGNEFDSVGFSAIS